MFTVAKTTPEIRKINGQKALAQKTKTIFNIFNDIFAILATGSLSVLKTVKFFNLKVSSHSQIKHCLFWLLLFLRCHFVDKKTFRTVNGGEHIYIFLLLFTGLIKFNKNEWKYFSAGNCWLERRY